MPHPRLIVALLLVTVLAACASRPRIVEISAGELQDHMTQALAVPIALLRIFDIQLDNPTIRLENGSDRLTADLDTRIGQDGRTLAGRISISGTLRYDAAHAAIVLTDSRIEGLDMSNLQPDDGRWLNLLAVKVGEGLLDGVPLYPLAPDALKRGNTYYLPQKFSVVGDVLQVTLLPQPR